jgi:hypothetical protein
MTAALSRNSAHPSGPDHTFHEFARAVMSLVHGGCCAAPSLSVMGRKPAPPLRQNTKFRRLGREAWNQTVSPRDPILQTIRNAFVLPDVTVAHTDRPDEQHVDVLVSQGNIERITPTGAANLPPGATVFEHVRGGFVSSALIDMHVHMPPTTCSGSPMYSCSKAFDTESRSFATPATPTGQQHPPPSRVSPRGPFPDRRSTTPTDS